MPAAWRCASVSLPCEVLAGWHAMVLVSPRLVASESTCRLSSTWNARWRASSAAGVRTAKDSTAPPRPLMLAHGQVVLRVALQPRVVHPLHRGVLFQPLRQFQRLR
jgi:hypothetical protein